MNIAIFALNFVWCPVLISSPGKVLSCHTAAEKVTDANELNLSRCTIWRS